MQRIKEWFESYFSYLAPKNILFTDIVEIILITIVIYHLIIWIRDTKAWSLVKGLAFLVIIWIAAEMFQFNAIRWIFVNTINVGIIALIIIFQPELRRALEQLGRRNISLFSLDFKNENKRFSDRTVSELVSATFDMAAVKTGALMVIEGETSLGEYERTGIKIDAEISAGLLINIFEHNTPLHDGAVIIRGDRITAATCILPVSDNMQLSKELGTRHRAGVGLSEITDAFVIIVSEENGKVSLARNGQLIRGVDEMYLKSKLAEIQKNSAIINNAIKTGGTRKLGRKAEKAGK
ncbi:MAG: diadenylate cyclase CdaA [Lachnospiraceae bacterium]|nr:diadenylate cyclase CdaA [Lachnospiraceae bacterium]MBR6274524.1 diadenylate cyclase CdaA [Lachnospiraceae bacterium]